MIELISQAINRLGSVMNLIKVKNVIAAVLFGLILLTSSVSYADTNPSSNKIDSEVFEGDPDRPTTTREWQKEARETEGEPLERIKEIGKESVDALEDWAELYPDTLERSAPDALKDS